MKNHKTIQSELDKITAKHNGLLRPKDIVAFAANPQTALHNRFEWDDSKAANDYRLWQARELIAVYVKVLHKDSEPVRAYVSLLNDRRKSGGGYRRLDAVLTNKQLRESLLQEAIAELERFEAKYKQLKELAGVFSAVRRVKKRKAVA